MSSNAFQGWGTNIQNIEKSVRRLYWADDGKLLGQTDQSGAEALIVAYEAPPGKFIQLFQNNVKPHVYVAINMFLDTWQLKLADLDLKEFSRAEIKNLKSLPGWNELDKLVKESDNWQPSERYYYIAKQTCHSANYDCQANAFQMNVLEKSGGKIVLSKPRAEKILSDYRALFPEIPARNREVDRQMRDTKILFNLFGFPFQMTGELTESNKKEGYAFGPQSTVGCITHICLTREQTFIEISGRKNTVHQIPRLEPEVDEALQRFGAIGADWDILQNGHDSSLGQAPEDQAIDMCRVKKFFMEQWLTSSRGVKFQMKSESAVGKNWSPFHETKNPDGLREVKL